MWSLSWRVCEEWNSICLQQWHGVDCSSGRVPKNIQGAFQYFGDKEVCNSQAPRIKVDLFREPGAYRSCIGNCFAGRESCWCRDHISVPDFPETLHQPTNVHANLFVAAADVCNYYTGSPNVRIVVLLLQNALALGLLPLMHEPGCPHAREGKHLSWLQQIAGLPMQPHEWPHRRYLHHEQACTLCRASWLAYTTLLHGDFIGRINQPVVLNNKEWRAGADPCFLIWKFDIICQYLASFSDMNMCRVLEAWYSAAIAEESSRCDLHTRIAGSQWWGRGTGIVKFDDLRLMRTEKSIDEIQINRASADGSWTVLVPILYHMPQNIEGLGFPSWCPAQSEPTDGELVDMLRQNESSARGFCFYQ